jgi:hypothetical protein
VLEEEGRAGEGVEGYAVRSIHTHLLAVVIVCTRDKVKGDG